MARLLETAPAQVAVASLLSLLMGTIFSLNVFTESVERSAPQPHGLDNVWAPSVSSVFFLSSPVMVPCALLLSASPAATRSAAMRRFLLLAAFGFALFAFAAPAVRTGSRVLVSLTVAVVAVPLGTLAVIIMEHLAAWVPGSFGLAVALSTLTYSFGTILGASGIHTLLQNLSVPNAICVAALSTAVPTILGALLIRLPYPPPQACEDQMETDGEARPIQGEPAPLTFTDLAGSRCFWLFVFLSFSFGATFPILPYFFEIGLTYKEPETTVLRWFQGGTAATMVFNVATASFCDFLRTRRGMFSSGARNVLVVMFAMQACVFSALWQLSADDDGDFGVWALFATIQRLVYQSGFGMSALLAADLFGERNIALAFGTGAGIALGCGEGAGTGLILLVDAFGSANRTPSHYRPYYTAGLVWSLLTLASLFSMRRMQRPQLCHPENV